MTGPIFLMLLSINFNVAAGNPKGTDRSAVLLNKIATWLQMAAMIWALVVGVDSLLS